ncbi:Lysosomal protein NCU-G1 [Habropoda laboriosa]|uniref:Lysosomal protein NCU-G1 n=1 Tax=Habropoda laboriosa TaxID=597456 RepID=A0A0L7RG53_9HYME|nr:Lysosomal protein NCU-G1 [Habropoda laboriosa]
MCQITRSYRGVRTLEVESGTLVSRSEQAVRKREGDKGKKQLRSWVNPDCGTICKDKNLTTVYLRADGPNDTLHYLWDFDGNPSVLLALTSPSASLNISWEHFLAKRKDSIVFTEEPVYTFGVILNKIIEFNDINDTAFINIANLVNTNTLYPMFFQWEQIMPYMLHTENSTQVDIILDNIETNKSFNRSRFAIELLVVGGGNPNIPMLVNPKKTVDDEHTPGIFEVIEARTPPYKSMDNYRTEGAYLQWRPVSYTSVIRDVTNSTETIQYPPLKVSNHTSAIRNSMLYCYYGDKVDDMLTQRIIVSLGTTGDGFYKRTHYSTWTFLIGYGTPPTEHFSYLVIMIISIGLGLPLIIMLAIGSYFCICKLSKRNSEAYLNQ